MAIHMYTHTHTHTHTYIYIYIYIYAWAWLAWKGLWAEHLSRRLAIRLLLVLLFCPIKIEMPREQVQERGRELVFSVQETHSWRWEPHHVPASSPVVIGLVTCYNRLSKATIPFAFERFSNTPQNECHLWLSQVGKASDNVGSLIWIFKWLSLWERRWNWGACILVGDAARSWYCAWLWLNIEEGFFFPLFFFLYTWLVREWMVFRWKGTVAWAFPGSARIMAGMALMTPCKSS